MKYWIVKINDDNLTPLQGENCLLFEQFGVGFHLDCFDDQLNVIREGLTTNKWKEVFIKIENPIRYFGHGRQRCRAKLTTWALHKEYLI